jgi:hypothetical protein
VAAHTCAAIKILTAMNNSLADIQHPTGNWLVRHDLKQVGGPLLLQENGNPLLQNFHHRCDDFADDLLVPDKVRLFRKSGAAVFNSEGHFPFGAGISLRQNIRYAANHARITTDLCWKKGASLKNAVSIGSARLPGKWDALFVLQADGEAPSWQALTPGTSCRFSPLPLSLVFRNQQGQRLEIGTGDDLWRWQKGLLPDKQVDSPCVELSIQPDCILFQRLVTVNPVEEEYFPEARDYRFTSFLAWSAPALEEKSAPPCEPIALTVNSGDGLSRKQLLDCGDNPCVSIDFTQLELPHQARHSLGSGYCWESKITQRSVRRLIRQLAAFSARGFLQINGGMTPGLCDDPVHCSRKVKAAHWDLSAILDLASWMRQCLGDGWTINVRQPQPYNEMPSLIYLAAANGFRLQKENNEEEDNDS